MLMLKWKQQRIRVKEKLLLLMMIFFSSLSSFKSEWEWVRKKEKLCGKSFFMYETLIKIFRVSWEVSSKCLHIFSVEKFSDSRNSTLTNFVFVFSFNIQTFSSSTSAFLLLQNDILLKRNFFQDETRCEVDVEGERMRWKSAGMFLMVFSFPSSIELFRHKCVTRWYQQQDRLIV